MAKDTEIKDDVEDAEVLDNQELGDKEDQQPTDIRSGIKAAIKEVEEKGDEDPEDQKEEDNRQSSARETGKKGKEETSKIDGNKQSSDKQKSDDGQTSRVEDKTEPPPYYKTKGKAVWDKLTPEDKQLIIAREQEVSQGFANISPKVRAFDELEKVISPRLEAIQKFGTTPAQTVDRLFQWMEALSHPDDNTRLGSFKQLAANFGINLAQLGVSEHVDSQTDINQDPPAWAQGIVGEVTNLKQQLTSQQQAAADNVVINWATAKSSDGTPLRPHYSKVNELMVRLMQSGAVPMKNGTLDLDGAYETACKIHPEVAALIQQETVAKAEQETKDKAAKDAQLAKARLEKAKKAGVGLKPSAPSIPSTQIKGKPNGTGRETTSVRDSLRKSLDELRDN